MFVDSFTIEKGNRRAGHYDISWLYEISWLKT